MAISETSAPVVYPLPPQTIFQALHAALPYTKIRITHADPARGVIWADRSISFLSWGEKVTIYVQATPDGQTAVTIHSSLKFGLVSWGVNKRNFGEVFNALGRVLSAGTPPPGPQGPPASPQPGYQQPGQQVPPQGQW